MLVSLFLYTRICYNSLLSLEWKKHLLSYIKKDILFEKLGSCSTLQNRMFTARSSDFSLMGQLRNAKGKEEEDQEQPARQLTREKSRAGSSETRAAEKIRPGRWELFWAYQTARCTKFFTKISEWSQGRKPKPRTWMTEKFRSEQKDALGEFLFFIYYYLYSFSVFCEDLVVGAIGRSFFRTKLGTTSSKQTTLRTTKTGQKCLFRLTIASSLVSNTPSKSWCGPELVMESNRLCFSSRRVSKSTAKFTENFWERRCFHGQEGSTDRIIGCSCKTRHQHTRPKRRKTWSEQVCPNSSKSTSASSETTENGHQRHPIWTRLIIRYGTSWSEEPVWRSTSQLTRWKEAWWRRGMKSLRIWSIEQWMTFRSD